MSGLTTSELRTIDWLESHRAAMLELLEELVNTDSGSNDKVGVDRAGEVLKRFFRRRGLL
jgi:glutamate carboxypeptidase